MENGSYGVGLRCERSEQQRYLARLVGFWIDSIKKKGYTDLDLYYRKKAEVRDYEEN